MPKSLGLTPEQMRLRRNEKNRIRNKKRDPKVRREYYLRNKEDISRKNKDRYHQGPKSTYPHIRKVWLKSRYGMTIEEYEERAKNQFNRCAICGRTAEQVDPKKRLAIDHNHTTNEKRGLLCRHCNTGLGLFQDDPNILRMAIDYLEVP